MDEKDRKILSLLMRDSKQRVRSIAKKLNMPVTTVHNRIKRMEEEGVIRGYVAIPDYKKIGKGIMAFILVSVQYNLLGKKVLQEDVAANISELEGVEDVHIITGDSDILVEARVRDIDELNNLVIKRLRNIDGVDKTKTMIVLSSINHLSNMK